MGDHRARISVKFTFHGKTYEIKEASWNWVPDEDGGVLTLS